MAGSDLKTGGYVVLGEAPETDDEEEEIPSVTQSVTPSVTQSVAPGKVEDKVGTSVIPSVAPSVRPSMIPGEAEESDDEVEPASRPSVLPSVMPSVLPSVTPSVRPSVALNVIPSVAPSVRSSMIPGEADESDDEAEPASPPSVLPSVMPSVTSNVTPSVIPSMAPSVMPSVTPSMTPDVRPRMIPAEAEESNNEPPSPPSPLETFGPVNKSSLCHNVQPALAPGLRSIQIHNAPPYNTLLHKKQREVNTKLNSDVTHTYSKELEAAGRSLKATSLQMNKSKQMIQETCNAMRMITNDLFKLEDKINIVASCTLLPDMRIPTPSPPMSATTS